MRYSLNMFHGLFQFLRDAVYARYTDCDWDLSNNVNYCMAEHERDLAQEARKCAWDTVALSEKVTVMRRRDNEKKLCEINFFTRIQFFMSRYTFSNFIFTIILGLPIYGRECQFLTI